MHPQLDFTVAFDHDGFGYLARPAALADIETLRVWKNAHRAAFFTQTEITSGQQAAWFRDFSQKTDQQMFLLVRGEERVGCVGYRCLAPGVVDLFNLILGKDELAGTGLMTAFCRCLEGELARRGVQRIRLTVLSGNGPAIAFYHKLGFAVLETRPEALVMEKALA
jgi:ribosomal protein S18 acetylase RimI-like enzyme